MKEKLNILNIKKFAKQKMGMCLSESYKNIDGKLLWRCKFGHQWEASFYNVKKKRSWCPYCAGVAKKTLADMHKLAKGKMGKCLSKKYVNATTKLLWQCEFGHQWWALYSPIKSRGIWCPECSGMKKLTIDDMKQLAELKNGQCLSEEYVNNNTKLLWQCEAGHRWWAIPSSVKCNDSWCPLCAGTKIKTLEEMVRIAESRSGKCLSNEYVNVNTKLEWECEYGHRWNAVPRDIISGKWCPQCYKGKRKGENAVRKFFENIFDRKFPSIRPTWLTYDGNRLELDGYCEDLKLAFEYQGLYHSKESAYWYPNKSMSFERRQHIDLHKVKVCKENGVKLIQIDEFNIRKKPDFWKDKIKKQLLLHEVDVPKCFDSVSFGGFEFYSSKNYNQEADRIAKQNRGICHSKDIIYHTQPVNWECEHGHTWTATLIQITRCKTWCPECAGV